MNISPKANRLARWEKQYARRRQQLAQLGYLSQGSVVARRPPASPPYQWTRKEKAKTVSVALSKAQFNWLKEAVANQRRLSRIIQQMQKLSRQILFATVPGVSRRKRLSRKVLGLI